VFNALGYFEPVKTAKDWSNVTRFRSYDNSNCHLYKGDGLREREEIRELRGVVYIKKTKVCE